MVSRMFIRLIRASRVSTIHGSDMGFIGKGLGGPLGGSFQG